MNRAKTINIVRFAISLLAACLWPGLLFAVVLDESSRPTAPSTGDSLLAGSYQMQSENLENGHFFQLSVNGKNMVRSTQQFNLAGDTTASRGINNLPSRQEISLSDSSLFEQNIGAFLENLNDSPALKTIYFNSQQLKFTVQSTIANEFGDFLNDDMPLDKRLFMDNSDRLVGTSAISREVNYSGSRPLFDQVMESLQSLGAIIILFFALIYLAFRYVLNKYV
ncbi:hypothetical protein [Emcibacter sp.]|uniref:hypothetical protein n=1 Tax=Emcibacter sp. TaxID=1979954 RepID=UPI003A8C91CB